MRYPLPWLRSLVFPNSNNRRTKPVCLHYRSSHVGCRFCRSGSSGLVGRLLRLRLSNREPVLRVHSCLGRNNSCGSRPAAKCLQKQSRFHPPKISNHVSNSPAGRHPPPPLRPGNYI